ncbi:MAG: metallothionein [Pseudomonadota bacterium]
MSVAVNTTCACPKCECAVSAGESIEQDGRLFCSQPCADGHPNGKACSSPGCTCAS